MLTPQLEEKLKEFINEDYPFGPLNAGIINDDDVMRILFDNHNKVYTAMIKRPAIVVGRKGSGKTAFLQSLKQLKRYRIVAELKTWETFSQIVKDIARMSKGGPVYPESVSLLWETALWTAVMAETVKEIKEDSPPIKTIKNYLSKIGISSDMDSDLAISTALQTLSTRGGGEPISMASELQKRLSFGKLSYSKALAAVQEVLTTKKINAIVLMDSIDDYNLESGDVVHAISGLLKCLGEFNFRFPRYGAQVRFCLPAEIYFAFIKLSSNPLKDFELRLLIHWHAGELLKITAHRYALFAEMFDRKFYKEIASLNLDERAGSVELFNKLLPSEIKNRGGIREPTISYILRHTQLLPRHLLRYLNDITVSGRNSSGSSGKIPGDAIIGGIRKSESSICREIFAAFKFQYPHAEGLCRASIPELRRVFKHGDLQRVFNQHVKRHMQDEGFDIVFDDFRKMLFEIGAVGRAIGPKGENYIEGVFEYTVPDRLPVSSDDELCVHPMFSGTFVPNKSTASDKFIYPFGSDPFGEDIRQL